MKVLVLVHPGSVFVSGSAEVADWKLAEVIGGIVEDIEAADGLVVIDGAFSERVSSDLTRAIAAKLESAAASGMLAARVWGCDSGEAPYPGWEGRASGFGLQHADQETAALAAAGSLQGAQEVIVSGAWATRNGSSGCASSVLTALQAELPSGVTLRLSGNCLFEEYIEEFSVFDELPEREGADHGGLC